MRFPFILGNPQKHIAGWVDVFPTTVRKRALKLHAPRPNRLPLRGKVNIRNLHVAVATDALDENEPPFGGAHDPKYYILGRVREVQYPPPPVLS
jgi:hypothetical protein